MDIIDELVETIQGMWVRWRFDGTSDVKVRPTGHPADLLALRSIQYEKMQQEVRAGRMAVRSDFARANDQAWLLRRRGDFQKALEVVEWLMNEADRGGCQDYLGPLSAWRERLLAKRQRYAYNIYIATASTFGQELQYSRRLPSFHGPHAEYPPCTWQSIGPSGKRAVFRCGLQGSRAFLTKEYETNLNSQR